MAGTLKEEAVVLALQAMALLKSTDAPKVEQLSEHDQCRIYKVYGDGRPLLVRSSSKGGGAAAHFYATTAARGGTASPLCPASGRPPATARCLNKNVTEQTDCHEWSSVTQSDRWHSWLERSAWAHGARWCRRWRRALSVCWLAGLDRLAEPLRERHRIRRRRCCVNGCGITARSPAIDARAELHLGGTHLCQQCDRIECAIELAQALRSTEMTGDTRDLITAVHRRMLRVKSDVWRATRFVIATCRRRQNRPETDQSLQTFYRFFHPKESLLHCRA
jgi:hypothetical protein